MDQLGIEEISDLLKVTHHLADLSGKEILPYFRTIISVDNKEGKGLFDPVTKADRDAESMIRAFLNIHHKEESVYGEEFGFDQKPSDLCWIIDPIDGTRAFMLGSPLWGTLIGVNFKDAPLIGLMNQPFTKERFWASPEGAFGRWQDKERRLRVRTCNDLSDAVITTTCPDHFATKEDLERFDRLRHHCKMTRFGGDCYNYCLLAMGQIDLIAETGLAPFDIAPLIPIVSQAGGVITDWSGGPAHKGGRVIAAGDPAIHEAALRILSEG